MPYANFHAARIRDPDDFDHIIVLKTLDNGIMIYGGPLKSDPEGPTKTQSYRFPKDKFTVAEAKAWLKEHDIEYILFEPAGETESKRNTMIHFADKEFETKPDLFRFMSENKKQLIAQKKAAKKEVDCSILIDPRIVYDEKTAAIKADGGVIDPVKLESLKVVAIINTTNYFDAHYDVHIPGIWTKSLQDNKMIMHVQEHEMAFNKIIASGDQLKAYVKKYKWTELGYDFEGETEALVFESEILRERNAFMLNQYAKGWVKNHSVGMYYVKLDFALNDENYPNEYEAWKKYYPQIANKDEVDERGYFWYVLEAKIIEGSAVPLGSNPITPTMNETEVEEVKEGIDYKFIREGLNKKKQEPSK